MTEYRTILVLLYAMTNMYVCMNLLSIRFYRNAKSYTEFGILFILVILLYGANNYATHTSPSKFTT